MVRKLFQAKPIEEPADPVIIAVYQTLYARYENHTDKIWLIPSLILAAETLLFAGVFAISSRLAVGVLGVLGFVIAFVGLMTMRRFDLSALLDRNLLDIYEERLLGLVKSVKTTEKPWPRLAHGIRFPDRIKHLAVEQGLPPGSMPRGVFYGGSARGMPKRIAQATDRLVMARFPSSGGWYALLALRFSQRLSGEHFVLE
jgi:hypothetical protein